MNLHPTIDRLIEKLNSDDGQRIRSQLIQFKERLLKVNQKINLVSRRSTAKVVDKLIFDSLTLLRAVDFIPEAKILDVGSGAGFPWLPIRIVRSDLRVVSVEANWRKVEFMRSISSELKFTQCEIHAMRAEELPPQEADYLLAKAVGSAKLQADLALRHLRQGGFWLFVFPKKEGEAASVNSDSRFEISKKIPLDAFEKSESRQNFNLFLLKRL